MLVSCLDADAAVSFKGFCSWDALKNPEALEVLPALGCLVEPHVICLSGWLDTCRFMRVSIMAPWPVREVPVPAEVCSA